MVTRKYNYHYLIQTPYLVSHENLYLVEWVRQVTEVIDGLPGVRRLLLLFLEQANSTFMDLCEDSLSRETLSPGNYYYNVIHSIEKSKLCESSFQ